MPEGDTIHKLARALAPALEGRNLRGLWLRDRGWLAPVAGQRVCEVAAVGKHMLVATAPEGRPDPSHVLHVHLGMNGRWHAYAPDEAWRHPARDASIRIETSERRYVCFRASRAEWLRSVEVALHPVLSRLGPDLLAPRIDVAAIVRRARTREPRRVVDLLLDQTVACGIGNVFKNEVLFLEGLHPATSAAGLDDARLGALYRRARRLLRRNLGGWLRTTVRPVDRNRPLAPGEPRYHVYERTHQPCLHCRAPIRHARLGDAARTTWWCPSCQPGPGRRP